MKRTLRQVLAAQSRRRAARRSRRRVCAEQLEARNLLASMPFGAVADDNVEYLLGSVLVTPVLFESNGNRDPSTEDWDAAQIADIKAKLIEGAEWWSETLDQLDTVHSLQFKFDWTYVDNPVDTIYEPISRTSNFYTNWVNEFLVETGFKAPLADIHSNVMDFNHAQREAHETNWAFSIFIANSENDQINDDGKFDPQGSFSQAFAFAKSKFIVMPSTRPASTIAHEIGHIGWGFDEYVGGSPHTARRGYYNAENSNAFRTNDPSFVQQRSIMTAGVLMQEAYDAFDSPDSTLALVGWQDTDNDGVFDVLDVPHKLEAFGIYDAASQLYSFSGYAEVDTLPNQNSDGLQNDITINKIDRLVYRIDGGAWQTAATYNDYQTNVAAAVSIPSDGFHQVEFRTETIDPVTLEIVTTSPIFVGNTGEATYTSGPGLSGIIYSDFDQDGQFNGGDVGIPGRVVKLANPQNGQPIVLKQVVEPDDFGDNILMNNANPDVVLNSVGSGVSEPSVFSSQRDTSSTGDRVFAHVINQINLSAEWTDNLRELRMDFNPPVSRVSIDAVGNVLLEGTFDYGRLEAYDADGNLLERYSTGPLGDGDVETMVIERSTADIAYALAFGSNGTAVRLDNLEFGPETQTITDNNGIYYFPGVPSGQYLVINEAPAGDVPVSPADPSLLVTMIDDQVTDVNFGFVYNRPYQNPDDRFDIDGKGGVSPTDIALVASNINVHGVRRLPGASELQAPPYIDVNGDGKLTPLDLAQLAQHLVQTLGGSAENEWSASGSASGDGTAAAPAQGEGEAASWSLTTVDATRRSHDAAPAGRHEPALDLGRIHDRGLENYLQEQSELETVPLGNLELNGPTRLGGAASFQLPAFHQADSHESLTQPVRRPLESESGEASSRQRDTQDHRAVVELLAASRWSRWIDRWAQLADDQSADTETETDPLESRLEGEADAERAS